MARLSNKAFAIIATCPEVNRTYGITVDCNGSDSYIFHWAFPIDKDKARHEGYDTKHVHGTVSLDSGYPGCPYCGSKKYVFCGNCGNIICYNGKTKVTCPLCGFSGEVSSVESVDLKGGAY